MDISSISDATIFSDKRAFDDFEILINRLKDKTQLNLENFYRIQEVIVHYGFNKGGPVDGWWIEGIEKIYVSSDNEFIPTEMIGRIPPDEP